MYTYNVTQWIAFFILYCFLGWCWESPYVSIKEKKWVNRGFMHGPFLPIYGSGAIIVLMASLPLKGSVVAVYFAGMTAATILEYVTGAAMEAIFKVRYWDYSNQKFNLNGHICLTSSIAWGFFSIGMVYGLHKPFEKFVLSIPDQVLVAVVDVLMLMIAADFALSFKAAIELRDVLIALEKAKHEARLMQKRLDVIEAVLADEAQQKRAKYEQELSQKMDQLKQSGEAYYMEMVEHYDQLKEKYDQLQISYQQMSAEGKQKLVSEMEELKSYLEKKKEQMSVKKQLTKEMHALLRRNPSATSGHFSQSLIEFKKEVMPEWPFAMMEKAEELKDGIKQEMEERKAALEKLLEELKQEFESKRK